MTVNRSKEQIYPENRTEVARKIRKILERNPPYISSVEDVAETLFMTTVKPNFFLVGTDMSIILKDVDAGTHILVEIESQKIIIGDKYNYYGRYIDDFLNEIEQGYTAGAS